MKIFIDANILVTVVCNEYPQFTLCSRVLSLTDARGFEVYTSPLCLAIAYYFAQKKNGPALARKKIVLLANKLKITTLNDAIIKSAANNPLVHDFEDGMQYYAALQAKCKCLITADKNDYYFSAIEVLSAEEFLLKHVVKS